MKNLLQAAQNVPANWERGDLTGAVRELVAATKAMPKLPKGWNKFDAFEMNGCIMGTEDNGIDHYFERCDDDDPELSVWSLYGHTPEVGVSHIADFPKHDRALCSFFCDLLNSLYGERNG